MNVAKAKDYFSAYYEGSLDRGLRQTFEVRLKEDAQLQAEYRAFERTMKDLEAIGLMEVEPPADLHEKIAARLDHAIWEQKNHKRAVLSLPWWKGLAMGLAVAAGVAVAFISFKSVGLRADTANLGWVPGSTPEQFTFAAAGGQSVMLSYPRVAHRQITIRDEASGEVVDAEKLTNQGIESKPLQNIGTGARLLSIEIGSAGPSSYIALPGKSLDSKVAGQGTLKDLALAISSHYGKPVDLEAKDDAQKTISWDLSSADAVEATNNAVRALGLEVQQNATGVISIKKV